MKFYKIASLPPHYLRTQAEAKGTHVAFELIERDTSQQGIVDFVNEVIKETLASKAVQPVASEEVLEPEQVEDTRPPAPTPPRLKDTKEVRHPKIVEIMNATAVEEFIWQADPERCGAIMAVLTERMAELARKTLLDAPVNPPARKRSA